MTNKDMYEVLVPWCQEEANLLLTDDERWDKLNTKNITEVQSTPISLRTLMNELTPEEYVAARTILNTAAESNVMMADAVAILANVGVWQDSGLDIGADAARTMIDVLFTGDYAALGTKIKALAEVQKSQIEVWAGQGYTVQRGHLGSAREMADTSSSEHAI